MNAWQIIEAETPKKTFKRMTDPEDLEAVLRRYQHQAQLDDTPRPDSWVRGQRIRRIRHNVFGARPHGGNPNDIGDLGTVIAFHGRKPDPERALYTCRWDRHEISAEYVTHRDAEAIPGEVVPVDGLGFRIR